jgi:hypothetical protein
VRYWGGVVGRGLVAGGFALEFVKQPVEILAVKDRRYALLQGHQARSPSGIKRPALDADVGHGVGEG